MSTIARPIPRDGSGSGRAATITVLRDRNFWPYFVGSTLSNHGTWFHNLAQTLLVYRLTGSVFLVGMVNFAQFAGVLVVGPWAGVLADRHDRRRILLVSQSLATVFALVLAVAAATGNAQVWLVMLIALSLGTCHAIGLPAMLALVPQLVGPAHLGTAVSLNLMTFNAARAIGPVLGAVVVARLGLAGAFALNVVSFATFVLALGAVRARPGSDHPSPPAEADVPPRPRLRDTLARLRDVPALSSLLLISAALSMATDPLNTLTPAFATDVLGRSDLLVGWLMGAFGLGSVLAAFTTSTRWATSDRGLLLAVLAIPVSFIAFSYATSVPLALLALGMGGFAYMTSISGAMTRLQIGTSTEEHGRVMALWGIAFMGARPLASLLDGVLASAVGLRAAVLIVGLPVVVAAYYFHRATPRV